MRAVTAQQMRTIEILSQIPEPTLMENAGQAAASEILSRLGASLGPVAIVCGPGNNGGDGKVIGRRLQEAGKQVQIISAQESPPANLENFEIVIDALFGIGLNRPLSGNLIKGWIDSINSFSKLKIAVDIPSGLDATKGIASVAVRADLTLTFGWPKIGFYTPTGQELCGEIKVLPIGISSSVCEGLVGVCYTVFTEELAQRLLPNRDKSSNKSTFGNVAVCAGHPGFWGAGILASQGAFRIGAGYVTWASEVPPVEAMKSQPEVLTSSLKDVLENPRVNAFVAGPGLGVGESTGQLIDGLSRLDAPAVIDADAITVIAQKRKKTLPGHWILTPHAGELSRLLGVSSRQIEGDRFQSVSDSAKKFGCTVLLKGNRTLVARGDQCLIIDAGNAALAKAGTGDVLAGFIGGLLAQGLSPIDAAALGAYVHGRVADEWVRNGKDIASLVASDVAEFVPECLNAIRMGTSK